MDKVTLVWAANDDQPLKVISVKKIFIYVLLGGTVFSLLSMVVGLGIVYYYHVKINAYSAHNKALQQELEKNKIKFSQAQSIFQTEVSRLTSRLNEKQQTVQELEHKLANSRNQLQDILDMENKVRIFLGLDPVQHFEGNQTHQGGFGLGDNSSNSSFNDFEEFANATYHIPQDVLRDSLNQLVDYLEKKQNKLNRIPSILPVNATGVWLSCPYGWRINPFTGNKEFHAAIDIAGPWKSPIIAPADGVVVKVAKSRVLGNYLRIDHGNGFQTLYGHLYKVLVKKGQKVKRKQLIALMGNTGHSTGTHVHYKIIKNGKVVNPKYYLFDVKEHSLALR